MNTMALTMKTGGMSLGRSPAEKRAEGGNRRGAAGGEDLQLPADVTRLNACTYLVRAGTDTITVTRAKVVLRRSGRLRGWARYLVGRIADSITIVEVFLGYPTHGEVVEWLASLPSWTAEARAAAHAIFEGLLERLSPGRLFAALDILAQLRRPARLAAA